MEEDHIVLELVLGAAVYETISATDEARLDQNKECCNSEVQSEPIKDQRSMSKEELDKTATINLPIGHLLVVWDVLSNKLSDSPYKDEFAEAEKRAIWALEDLCEIELVRNGFSGRSEKEWEALMAKATDFVKTIPAEFLD